MSGVVAFWRRLRNFALISERSEGIFSKLSCQDTNSFRWQGSSDEDCCTPLFCSQYETKAGSFCTAQPSGCTCFIIFPATQFPRIASICIMRFFFSRMSHGMTFVIHCQFPTKWRRNTAQLGSTDAECYETWPLPKCMSKIRRYFITDLQAKCHSTPTLMNIRKNTSENNWPCQRLLT